MLLYQVQKKKINTKVKKELLESILIFQYLLTKNHKWKKMLLNSLRHCQITKEKAQEVLGQLNNDWDGEVDDCIAYGLIQKCLILLSII